MKYLFILSFVWFFCLAGNAQNGFSKGKVQWFVDYYRGSGILEGGNGIPVFNMRYCYELKGDTAISGESWRKLYQDERLVAALLAKDNKIWFRSFVNKDMPEKFLMYDFSKAENESVSFEGRCEIDRYLGSLKYIAKPYEVTITKIDNKQGRKIVYLNNGDCWIEGIGSVKGFWGNYPVKSVDGSSSNIFLHHVLSDSINIFRNGQLVDLLDKSSFLKEGKSWRIKRIYIQGSELLYNVVLGAPVKIDNIDMYPFEKGYLYTTNGAVYWRKEQSDYMLYNFNLNKGDKVELCLNCNNDPYRALYPKYETYFVSDVNYVEYNGKKLKQIRLMGSIPLIWVEDLGNINGDFIYADGHIGKEYEKYELVCCQLNGELLYRNPKYNDCAEEKPVDPNRIPVKDELQGA